MRHIAVAMLSAAVLGLVINEVQCDRAFAQAEAQTNDSGTMARADADMRDVLVKLDELAPKPLPEVSAAEARKQPTSADCGSSLAQKPRHGSARA